jgi:hypothetical protein
MFKVETYLPNGMELCVGYCLKHVRNYLQYVEFGEREKKAVDLSSQVSADVEFHLM